MKGTIKDNATFGIVEFGSSSTQIAFQQKKAINESSVRTVDIDERKQIIYGHSYLCYGIAEMGRRTIAKLVKNASYKQTVKNPCFFSGFNENVTSDYLWAVPCSSGDYAKTNLGEDISGPAGKTYTIQGSGNFEQCYQLLKDMINTKCSNKTTCGINDQFQPQVQGNFFALGAFESAAATLKLTANSGKVGFFNATKKLCGRPWAEADTFDAGGLSKYTYNRCFQSAYGYYLLDMGFKFDAKAWKVEYRNEINGTSIGWSLGLLYTNKNNMYARMESIIVFIRKPSLIAMIAIGVVCLIVGIFIAFKVPRSPAVVLPINA